MTAIETQLEALQPGKSKKIRGIQVRRDDTGFIIEDELYSLEEAAEYLKDSGKKRQKFPYESVAFLLVKPPGRVVSTHQIKNRSEHSDLLEKAKEKKYVVYYADVKKMDDGKYYAVQPWIVDWESVDNLYGPVEELGKDKSKPSTCNEAAKMAADDEKIAAEDELRCPFCNKKMNSTPGRTLHVKSKHPDRYEEYMKSK